MQTVTVSFVVVIARRATARLRLKERAVEAKMDVDVGQTTSDTSYFVRMLNSAFRLKLRQFYVWVKNPRTVFCYR